MVDDNGNDDAVHAIAHDDNVENNNDDNAADHDDNYTLHDDDKSTDDDVIVAGGGRIKRIPVPGDPRPCQPSLLRVRGQCIIGGGNMDFLTF
jgi:hypothetical protein